MSLLHFAFVFTAFWQREVCFKNSNVQGILVCKDTKICESDFTYEKRKDSQELLIEVFKYRDKIRIQCANICGGGNPDPGEKPSEQGQN